MITKAQIDYLIELVECKICQDGNLEFTNGLRVQILSSSESITSVKLISHDEYTFFENVKKLIQLKECFGEKAKIYSSVNARSAILANEYIKTNFFSATDEESDEAWIATLHEKYISALLHNHSKSPMHNYLMFSIHPDLIWEATKYFDAKKIRRVLDYKGVNDKFFTVVTQFFDFQQLLVLLKSKNADGIKVYQDGFLSLV
jgi:hypothetical protein